MLERENFDALFCSPLLRAKETADIIWGERKKPRHVLPSLREVDLYSFQGLLKDEGKSKYGERYVTWQKDAANFCIDGHFPVRELWYRASLAWEEILGKNRAYQSSLVVAHNAVNQALLATAMGLSTRYFRRMLQSNASVSVLVFYPKEGNFRDGVRPRVILDRLNQSPGLRYGVSGTGRKALSRLVFVRHGGTTRSEEGLVAGRGDEPCSSIGRSRAEKTAEFLLNLKVDTILTSPMQRAQETAHLIATRHSLDGRNGPMIIECDELAEFDFGSWANLSWSSLSAKSLPQDSESIQLFWGRTAKAWDEVRELLEGDDGKNVLIVGHEGTHAAVLCHCLGLGPESIPLFRINTGGVTVIEFPDGVLQGKGVLCSLNCQGHLGEGATPLMPKNDREIRGMDAFFLNQVF